MNRQLILRSISFLILLNPSLAASSRFSHQKCGLYGLPPCNYVPAPSGVTPVCATPGKTYCESVPQYPVQTVRQLVVKWGTENANDLIVDETIDAFEAMRNMNSYDQEQDHPNFFQTPNLVPNNNAFGFDEGYNYPDPSRGNTPTNYNPEENVPKNGVATSNGYNYQKTAAPTGSVSSGLYTANQSPKNNFANRDQYRLHQQPSTSYSNIKADYYRTTEYDPARWFKRYVRQLSTHKEIPSSHVSYANLHSSSSQTSKSLAHSHTIIDSMRQIKNETDSIGEDDENSKYRAKRQSPGRQQLCQTNFQYVTPQAALNSQGNWMYVVNQVDTSQQLVRTETCASSVCSNLCQLPNGYTSRCEQKYVQKRLIALNADGTNLYTDTFWFPSCCACTIAPQN